MLKTPQKMLTEFSASADSTNIQTHPTEVGLNNGDFVVVWQDTSQGAAIRQQHFDALGNPVGGPSEVAHGNDARPAAAVLTDGSYVVTWDTLNNNHDDISAQHFAQDGTPLGNAFLVKTKIGDDETSPAITALADGGCLITWGDASNGLSSSILAQRFDANMAKVGAELVVGSNFAVQPDAVTLANGSMVVAWSDAVNNFIEARAYDAQGNALTNAFAISAGASGVKLAPLTNGGFVAVWFDAGQGTIDGRVFDAKFQHVSGFLTVNSSNTAGKETPSVTELKQGGFFVSWNDDTPGAAGAGPNGHSIHGQVLDNSGNKIGQEIIVSSTTSADPLVSHVSQLASGKLIDAWTYEFAGGNPVPGKGIDAQLLDPNTVAPHSDFNGDGNSDILWRNVNGTTVLWEMNGGQKIADVNLSAIPTDWSIQDTGDFNGDGHADVLWRNINGSTVLWEMNGGAKIADLNLSVIPLEWAVQGTGDFNADGGTDIIWRRASDGQTVLWEMDGAKKIADLNLNAISTDWHIQGVGDFNGDRMSDIVWRNTNGTTVLWEMNGGKKIADVNLNAIPLDWHVQGLGDFWGTGRSGDIVWRNDNGQTVLWEMNGGIKIADVNLNTISTDWHVAAIGDYNNDGKSDIVWRNDNGATVLWEMNGGAKVADVNLNSIPVDWALVQHHYDIV